MISSVCCLLRGRHCVQCHNSICWASIPRSYRFLVNYWNYISNWLHWVQYDSLGIWEVPPRLSFVAVTDHLNSGHSSLIRTMNSTRDDAISNSIREVNNDCGQIKWKRYRHLEKIFFAINGTMKCDRIKLVFGSLSLSHSLSPRIVSASGGVSAYTLTPNITENILSEEKNIEISVDFISYGPQWQQIRHTVACGLCVCCAAFDISCVFSFWFIRVKKYFLAMFHSIKNIHYYLRRRRGRRILDHFDGPNLFCVKQFIGTASEMHENHTRNEQLCLPFIRFGHPKIYMLELDGPNKNSVWCWVEIFSRWQIINGCRRRYEIIDIFFFACNWRMNLPFPG